MKGVIFMAHQANHEDKLREEIEKKVAILDDESYEFEPKFNGLDVTFIIIIAIISIAGLIWGGF